MQKETQKNPWRSIDFSKEGNDKGRNQNEKEILHIGISSP